MELIRSKASRVVESVILLLGRRFSRRCTVLRTKPVSVWSHLFIVVSMFVVSSLRCEVTMFLIDLLNFAAAACSFFLQFGSCCGWVNVFSQVVHGLIDCFRDLVPVFFVGELMEPVGSSGIPGAGILIARPRVPQRIAVVAGV